MLYRKLKDPRQFLINVEWRRVRWLMAAVMVWGTVSARAWAAPTIPAGMIRSIEQVGISVTGSAPGGYGRVDLSTTLAREWRRHAWSLDFEEKSAPSLVEPGRARFAPPGQDIYPVDPSSGFQWGKAFKQSMIFLGIQHAFRLSTEEGTRAELKGPFWKDYLKSLRSLRGWEDGDPFLVNYIGHPMMGAVAGYIQVQNDPLGIQEEVGWKRSYWISRLKALGWSAAYSTQFELGLISEATLGNIGIRPYGKARNPMAYVDIVITPVAGMGWQVGEDLLDKYFIRRFERYMPNRPLFFIFRGLFNPTRSFANIMRGKYPWHRDTRR